MAQVIINIPDTQLSRVLTAICAQYNYQATLPDGSANPQTQSQFAKQHLLTHIIQVVKAYEIQAASQSAAQTATSNVDTQVVLS